MLGRPDQALKLSEEALRRARQLKHPLTLAVTGIGGRLALGYYRREPEAARALVEAEIALAEEHGFGDWIAADRSLRGWVMAERGRAEEGIAELEANAALVASIWQMAVCGMLAQVHIGVGRSDQALEVLDEALAKVEGSGAHVDEPELRRLKGEAILKRDSSAIAEAEACFRKAIEIARRQSAKWWELRTITSLSRLLRDTNRGDEARKILAEIYNWFTEGFDLPDLQEARALLEELSK